MQRDTKGRGELGNRIKYHSYQPMMPFTEGLVNFWDWLAGHSTPPGDLGPE